MRDEDYIAGLLAERDNHARAAHKDPVKQVDAELTRMGYTRPSTAERAVDKTPRETRG